VRTLLRNGEQGKARRQCERFLRAGEHQSIPSASISILTPENARDGINDGPISGYLPGRGKFGQRISPQVEVRNMGQRDGIEFSKLPVADRDPSGRCSFPNSTGRGSRFSSTAPPPPPNSDIETCTENEPHMQQSTPRSTTLRIDASMTPHADAVERNHRLLRTRTTSEAFDDIAESS